MVKKSESSAPVEAGVPFSRYVGVSFSSFLKPLGDIVFHNLLLLIFVAI